MANSDEPWFGKKRIGWGYGPRTWQGFLIVLAILAVIGLARYLLQSR